MASVYDRANGELLLDPAWDPLRKEPAFAQLIEQARQPIDPIPNG